MTARRHRRAIDSIGVMLLSAVLLVWTFAAEFRPKYSKETASGNVGKGVTARAGAIDAQSIVAAVAAAFSKIVMPALHRSRRNERLNATSGTRAETCAANLESRVSAPRELRGQGRNGQRMPHNRAAMRRPPRVRSVRKTP